MTVTVVNVRRDAYDVYAGRTERYFPLGQTVRWGNPFVIGKHGGRRTVVEAHRLLLAARISMGEISGADLLELDGHRVGCHCAPHPCHADNLVEAVEAEVEDRLQEWADGVVRHSAASTQKLVEEHYENVRNVHKQIQLR